MICARTCIFDYIAGQMTPFSNSLLANSDQSCTFVLSRVINGSFFFKKVF